MEFEQMIEKCLFGIHLHLGSSARKRSSIQNGFSSNDIKIEAVAKTDSPPLKPAALRKCCHSLFVYNVI